jgi:hypothetical protein
MNPGSDFDDAVVAAYATGEPLLSIAARFQLPPAQVEAIVVRDTGSPTLFDDDIMAAYAAGEPVPSLAYRYQLPPERIEAIVARAVADPFAAPGFSAEPPAPLYPPAPVSPWADPSAAPYPGPPAVAPYAPPFPVPAAGPYPPQPYAPVGYSQAARPMSGAAVIALVLGIITVLGGFFLLLPTMLAWVFAYLGMRETASREKAGRGLAITGIVLAGVGTALTLLLVVPRLLLF